MLTWKDVVNLAQNGNPKPSMRVEKTDEEWKALLTAEQFRILRKKGTEARFSGEHCKSYDAGIYSCAGCDTDLFDSTIKFDSGTGWPSFHQPIVENSVKYEADKSFGMLRIEALCNTCDGHLGHVFRDGPKPSGLRYCINSESIKFNNHDK